MARMRRGGGGGSGLIIATVLFGIWAVGATGFALLFYSRQGDLQKRADDKAATLATYIKNNEQTEFLNERAAETPKGESYVHQLDADYRTLRQMVFGNPAISMEGIKEKLKGVEEGRTLMTYIEKLETNFAADEAKLATAAEDLKKAQANVTSIGDEKNAQADAYKKALDDEKAQMATIKTGYEAYTKESTDNIEKVATDRAAYITEIEGKIKGLETTVQQKDQEINSLKHRVADLTPKREGGAPIVDPSLLPDGSIVSILQEENLVYIDRGSKQHIVPGLTFEVYDRSTGVAKDEHGDLHGKATIEVVSMSDNASVCRIVRRSARKTILEGDIIANAVYDPNYHFKFMVFGDFDIDNTGQATQSDKQRIKTTIAQWGGTLSDDLTYDTDFLVLGQEPKFPDPVGQTIDPEVIKKHTAAVEKFNEYQKLIATAKSLSIPVLNQNRFLALVGYYRR